MKQADFAFNRVLLILQYLFSGIFTCLLYLAYSFVKRPLPNRHRNRELRRNGPGTASIVGMTHIIRIAHWIINDQVRGNSTFFRQYRRVRIEDDCQLRIGISWASLGPGLEPCFQRLEHAMKPLMNKIRQPNPNRHRMIFIPD
jgi:hypothetical protein